MKISIDTSNDSPEAIRKAMDLLAYLANNPTTKHSSEQIQPVTASSLAQEQNEDLVAGFSSMFGDDSQTTNTPSQSPSIPDTAPDFGSFLNLVNKTSNNNNDFDPKIEFF